MRKGFYNLQEALEYLATIFDSDGNIKEVDENKYDGNVRTESEG